MRIGGELILVHAQGCPTDKKADHKATKKRWNGHFRAKMKNTPILPDYKYKRDGLLAKSGY